MYIIKDKVFLHMVKSAGISVHVGLINSDNIINYNERHASIGHIPKKYEDLPRYGVIRSPEDWYQSFYKFFVGVDGYMSFMLNDPLPPDRDGQIYIKPINFNEFVNRSINLKDTLIKFPNKARVFNNILRSQANIHFVTAYFTEAIQSDKPETLEQFNMSLYEWFFRGCGMHTSTNIPIKKLEDIEDLFNIKIGHQNKTKRKDLDVNYDDETLKLVRETHKKFYQEIEEYKGIKV